VRTAIVACLLAACSPGACSQAADTSSDGGGGSGGAVDAGVVEVPPPPLPPRCADIAARIERATLEPHLARLAAIAKEHGGNRAHGTRGYDASVRYVVEALGEVGLEAEVRGMDVPDFHLFGPGVLEVTRPARRAFRAPARGVTADYMTMSGSPSGEVTAEVAAVGVELGPGNDSQSGCTAKDFDDGSGKSRVAGRIALLQRGGCRFVDKVRNASAAGAVAVIVFNQGDSADRVDLFAGGLDTTHPDHGIVIPAFLLTTRAAVGLLALLDGGPVEMHVGADTGWRAERVHNVILDIPGAGDEVFMLGAHLDSVPEGPGINDNGSGSASLLAIARELRGCSGARSLRFAWWGAEELGLVGSSAYMRALPDDATARIRAYVNLDMVAAPNHAFSVSDGDGSSTGTPGPATSGELEAFFRADFAARKIGLQEAPFIQRSDDKPFYDAGVGVVMLDAGFDQPKTGKQVALFGGTAGAPHDSCYHRACDDLGNVNWQALETIARSVARALHYFGVEGQGL
jgi:hypothetical protein